MRKAENKRFDIRQYITWLRVSQFSITGERNIQELLDLTEIYAKKWMFSLFGEYFMLTD